MTITNGVNRAYTLPTAVDLNLDAMTTPDLRAFALLCRGRIAPDGTGRTTGAISRRAARTLFPARQAGYVVATADLCAYAWNKVTARECRLRGDMQTASTYEDICDRIYARLPDWARGW